MTDETYTDAYADSFKISFGMVVMCVLWFMFNPGFPPLLAAGIVTLFSLFVPPFLLVWWNSNSRIPVRAENDFTT